MLNDFSGADKVYIACGYTDLRKGIDGLARMVQQQFELDPFTNTLFLFCGRRRDRIKGLYWEKDGFILLYKRLEQGAYQWPRSESEVRSLTPQQYRWLMKGLKTEQPKANRTVSGLNMIYLPKSMKSDGFFVHFLVSYSYGKRKENYHKYCGNGDDFTHGI